MSKQLRSSSAKGPTAKRHSTPAYEARVQQTRQPKDQSSKFKQRFQVIRSARQRRPLPEQVQTLAQPELKETILPSKSKFLEKFNNIKSSRHNLKNESKALEQAQLKRQEFEMNKKKLYLQKKLNNISLQSSIMISIELPKHEHEKLKKVSKNLLHVPGQLPKTRPISASIEFEKLNKVSIDQFILRNQSEAKKNDGEEKYPTAFWKQQNKFVSLIPLQKNEKVTFEHPNILQIYCEVTYNQKRYVVSDEYKNCSLQNLLEEFGNFSEQLSKRYLKQVALGLQHMHFYRRAHNRLSLSTILYNNNGSLFINTVSCTSFVPSKQDLSLSGSIYYFAPEFLLSNGFSKSLKNDVWALGCLAILMLTNTWLAYSPLHPYSKACQNNENSAQMVDNLLQTYDAVFQKNTQHKVSKRTKNQNLSDAARHFIGACLNVLADERPTIETLLQHQFFEGV